MCDEENQQIHVSIEKLAGKKNTSHENTQSSFFSLIFLWRVRNVLPLLKDTSGMSAFLNERVQTS